jgi:hypothetical protein
LPCWRACASRVDELTGAVRDAFLGQRGVELGPEWIARRLDSARPIALRDFARTLAADLVARSQRVALSKAVRRSEGTLWLPTRLQERGGFLFSRGREGSGDVGLRIDQLTTVLAGAGVLQRADGVWQVTPQGQASLPDDPQVSGTPSVEAGIPSPLALLSAEEAHADGQAEEALFLSYTADLGFFESLALGVTQACGARITVVGDADMASLDPRAVRRGGRSYLPGLASCTGAFHPKVVVLAGHERATVAIGSGNLTLAGWQANAELWTVLRADTERCPAVLGEISRWLRGLAQPSFVRFSPGVPEALGRVADLLDALLDGALERSDPDVRLVSTSDGPIIEQLPAGPVDELAVCAPFFDPGTVAVRALVKRLRPGRLTVSYQPDLTQFNGPSLADLAAEFNAEIRQDREPRYRHGKLVEWVTGGQRFALTGSPNLSVSALLSGLDDGGNCEAGLITPVAASKLPEGSSVPPQVVRPTRFPPRKRTESGPILLGASRIEQGVHVVLARPTPVAGHIELSPVAAPPEAWERVAAAAAATAELTVDTDAEGGSRVRLVTVHPDGVPRYSNIVLVVDPARVMRRSGGSHERAPTRTPEDLFTDPRIAEQLLAALADLNGDIAGAAAERAPRAGRPVDDERNGPGRKASLTWEQYLDQCAGRIGQPLLRFALGLPALPGEGGVLDNDLLRVSWDEQFADDTEAGLDDDSAEVVTDEVTAGSGPAALDFSGATEYMRRRYRRWAMRLADARYTAMGRLARIRCLMLLIAAGAWDPDDVSWFPLLAKGVRVLPREDPLGHDQAAGDPPCQDLPPEAEPQAASLAAIGLSVLREHAPRYAHTDEALSYQRAADSVAYLLPAAEPALIDEYTKYLSPALGYAVQPETVLDIAAEVVQDDPIADGVRALAEIRREAHAHGNRLLHITGRFGNPVLAALDGISAVENMELVGIWATSEAGRWALLIWHRPDLVVIDATQPDRPLWRHHQLNSTLTPKFLAAQKDLQRAPSVSHGAQIVPFKEAEELLALLGLPSPVPPTGC